MREEGGEEVVAAPGHWRKAVAVVSAVVRDGDGVLLVRNAGTNGAADRWSLPGGSVHTGELLTEAVVREVHEETGVVVHELGPLAVLSEHFIPAYAEPMMSFGFEVRSWSGQLSFESDPDAEVRECCFVEQREAAELIEQSTPFRPVGAPMVAYLRGDSRGRSWFWKIAPDGSGGDAPVALL